MLGIVLKDKEKIEQTIEELDWYKHDASKTAWEHVTLIQVDTELHVLDQVIRQRGRLPLTWRPQSNVLFHTRFRDRNSIVERTGKRDNSCLYGHGEHEWEQGTLDVEAMAVGRLQRAQRNVTSVAKKRIQASCHNSYYITLKNIPLA